MARLYCLCLSLVSLATIRGYVPFLVSSIPHSPHAYKPLKWVETYTTAPQLISTDKVKHDMKYDVTAN